MSVVRESSNLSETPPNAVSYIQKTTTPKTPLYETTQQAEGKVLLYLRQSPSACNFVPVDQLVDRLLCKQKAQDSSSCGHIPATFDPFGLPDTGAGIFRADSNYQG
jgi:hypothetical protein